MPQLDVEEAPQLRGMVPAPSHVLADEPLDDEGVEEPAGEGPLREKQFLDEAPQRSPQPGRERHEEADFSLPYNVTRQKPFRIAPRDLFQFEVPNLEPGGNSRGKFRNSMVEDGNAVLQGMGHGYSILNNQQGGKVRLDVQIERAIEIKKTREYNEYRNEIWDLLRSEVLRAREEYK